MICSNCKFDNSNRVNRCTSCGKLLVSVERETKNNVNNKTNTNSSISLNKKDSASNASFQSFYTSSSGVLISIVSVIVVFYSSWVLFIDKSEIAFVLGGIYLIIRYKMLESNIFYVNSYIRLILSRVFLAIVGFLIFAAGGSISSLLKGLVGGFVSLTALAFSLEVFWQIRRIKLRSSA